MTSTVARSCRGEKRLVARGATRDRAATSSGTRHARIAVVGLLGVLGCADLDGEVSGAGKGDLDPQSAAERGALRWDQLAPLVATPGGVPLLVSNNPELVHGFGVLAGVPFSGLALEGAQRAPGGPQAQWLSCDPDRTGSCERRPGAIVQQGCADGGVREVAIYLAHLLPADLGAGRHLSVVVHAAADATVTVRGALDTSEWSDSGESLVPRTDWLSARLARQRLSSPAAPRTVRAAAGQTTAVASIAARAVVEGRLWLRSDTCFHPFVVLHPQPTLTTLPERYAPGDVKWPGWSNGSGEGRAAGIYQGAVLAGRQRIAITSAPSVRGTQLVAREESMRALGKHGDSADILFGNYGVDYDQTFELVNETGHCIDLQAELVSYVDRHDSPGRTPTVAFFEQTPTAYTPSVLWNGPVRVSTGSGPARTLDALLRYAPSADEKRHPQRAVASMRATLATVRIDEDGSESLRLELPVPGFVVAPMAVVFSAESCPGEPPGTDPGEDPPSGPPPAPDFCPLPDPGVRGALCNADRLRADVADIASCTLTGGSTLCEILPDELREQTGCVPGDRVFCWDAGNLDIQCAPAGGARYCFDPRCFTVSGAGIAACGGGSPPTHVCNLVELFDCLHDASDPHACTDGGPPHGCTPL